MYFFIYESSASQSQPTVTFCKLIKWNKGRKFRHGPFLCSALRRFDTSLAFVCAELSGSRAHSGHEGKNKIHEVREAQPELKQDADRE